MNIRSFAQSILVKAIFNGAPTNATQTGTGVDTRGFRRAALEVVVTTGAATTVNYTVEDSPDNSTWTTVAGATLAAAQLASLGPNVYLVDIDLAKRQRYIRASIVGTGTAGTVSATLQLFVAATAPVTQDNAVIEV